MALRETPDTIEIDENADEQIVEHPDSKWYVIHTYSGYEGKVKKNLEHRIDSMGMKDKIYQVVVPEEPEVIISGGKRETVNRKLFPGSPSRSRIRSCAGSFGRRERCWTTQVSGPG